MTILRIVAFALAALSTWYAIDLGPSGRDRPGRRSEMNGRELFILCAGLVLLIFAIIPHDAWA